MEISISTFCHLYVTLPFIDLGQARTICEDKRTLLYTVEESANSQTPSAVHTVKNAEVVELTPITRLLSTAESEIVGSPIKAFYVCDLCMFTVDLTSLIGKYSNITRKSKS